MNDGNRTISEQPRDHPQSLVQNEEWNIFSAALDWYSEQLGEAPLLGAMDHLAWAAEAIRKLQAENQRLRAALERVIEPWDEKHGPLTDPVPLYVRELREVLHGRQ